MTVAVAALQAKVVPQCALDVCQMLEGFGKRDTRKSGLAIGHRLNMRCVRDHRSREMRGIFAETGSAFASGRFRINAQLCIKCRKVGRRSFAATLAYTE
jgi:hypothetical protein